METPKQNYITDDNYPAFKAAYEAAKSKGETVFWFEDQQVFTDYAKYVVQYVEKTT
jgi:hypothetical protein